MRSNTEILIETSLKDLVSARAGSATAVQAYAELIQQIHARCGPDVATLFAEPVLPAKPDPANPVLTWYTSLDGQMIELAGIDDVARAPVVSALKVRLAKLKPLLEDPELGPKIASWLFIPSAKSILSVGGNPVLVNWGYLPADVAASPSKRDSHFAATIGRYAPNLSLPPFTPEEQASYVARINRRAAATESPPPGVAAATAFDASTTAAMSAVSIDHASPRRGWVPALAAALIAAGVLMFLLWPGVLVYPGDGHDQAALDREAQILNDSNRTLEEKLHQFEDAARERVCRAPDGKLIPLAPGPNGDLGLPTPNPLAPPPNHVQVQPPGEAPPMLADQLFENAVVFIYGPSAKEERGVSAGSGFFISATQVVTNRHVVEGIQRDKIALTNKKLGRALPARLVAISDPDPVEEKTGMSRDDLAILEVEPGSHAFMKIGPSPTKMQDVWAIGYPGYITFNIDSTDTKRLLSGDLAAAPDSTIERGYVTTKPESLPVAEIVHSAKVAPGNSGGPLADLCGHVVGVNTLITRDRDNPISTNIAQDSSVLVAFLSAHGIGAEIVSSVCNPRIAADPPEPQGTPSTPGGSSKPLPLSAK